MEQKQKKVALILVTSILLSLFFIFTILVETVDVNQVGPNSIEVGFSSLNKSIYKSLSCSSDVWNNVSDSCLIISILVLGFIIGFGGYRAVRYKKITDSLLSFGITLAIMLLIWMVFEYILGVNYRPILVEGKKEFSYPSSHILFTSYILICASKMFSDHTKSKPVTWLVYIASSALIGLTFFGRIISSNHWFTDCIGSILLSAFLIMLFHTINYIFKKRGEE